jgi:protein disulfide-isomerase A1
MTEGLEITKIRFYKGASDARNQVKFVLRANKIQEERLVKWIKENAR